MNKEIGGSNAIPYNGKLLETSTTSLPTTVALYSHMKAQSGWQRR